MTNLPPEHRGVGLVFQNYALYPHLTVLKNITFPLENLRGADKLSREEMEKKALEAAKLVQLEGLMDRKPSELSGGQQQRVAIARALVKTPVSCCWTSPCPIWMPGYACRQGKKSAVSSVKPASPLSLSPTTKRKP